MAVELTDLEASRDSSCGVIIAACSIDMPTVVSPAVAAAVASSIAVEDASTSSIASCKGSRLLFAP